ncbi:CoA ester lyase [Mesotoga sp.]|uniref:HpcH/HpaI aldolase/citrate lyase family protein n=1 Tax=Mesotoga sp. TaxID=2053577 RepID=UPI00345E34C9
MSNEYILRTMMFVPGHNDKLLNSASRSMADALILDIEDSVMPAANKIVARQKIAEYVTAGVFKNFFLFPRVNDRESGYLLKDVYSLTIEGIDGFVYPKSRTGNDIYFFDKLLETIEAEKGFPFGKFKIVPLIETSGAVVNALDICQASERVVAIAFGCEDFIADLEGIHDDEGRSLFTPRAMLALAARAAGVIPVDTVHINVHDLDDFEENVILAKKLGFEGNLILHPKEIEIAHRHYTPSKQEIEDASEMLRLSNEAEKINKGVAVMDGKFIGPPMVIAAKKTLKKVRIIEEIEKRKQERCDL